MSVELTPEDSLMLNVLLAANPMAVRIVESTMTLWGLTEKGEANVTLHPNCRSDQYLRGVRELLAEHVLGSPGGYPVYLRRWTRMGQTRDENLDKLLLLGEPEAVVAVVHAKGLTNELARRAWWVMPTSENARRMLEKQEVINGTMGKVLVEYLVEHLPFEEENPAAIVHTVRLVLYSGLADESERQRLWNRSKSNAAYMIGFLEFLPDDLPNPLPPRPDFKTYEQQLAPLIEKNNPFAKLLLRLLSGPGQSFLAACQDIMKRPKSQEAGSGIINALHMYFTPARLETPCDPTVSAIEAEADALVAGTLDAPSELEDLLAAVPELHAEIRAMMMLSRIDDDLVYKVLTRTTATGTLLTRKLEPIFGPLSAQMDVLRGKRTQTAASAKAGSK